MGKINIDKYFKKRLSSYSEEIDTDAIWSNLDLTEKKKNRGIIFWLFGSMSILALLALGYFGLFASENETAALTQKPALADHKTSNYKEVDIKTSTPTIEVSEINEKIITEKDKWHDKHKSRITNETSTHSNKQVANKLLTTNTNSHPQKANGNSTTIIKTSIEPIQNNPNSNQNTSLSNETDQKTTLGLDLLHLASIDMLDIKRLEYTSQIDDFKDEVDHLIIDPLIIKNNQSFEVDFYSSYNIAQRRITTDFQERLGAFIQSKNESETILDAISVGTSIRYSLRSGLYAKLGIEAMNITERFNHSEESTETVEINGFARGTRPVISRWINYNHHKLLSIPLSVGYQHDRGRWSYYGEGGFHLNLIYQFSGLQLDLEGNVTEKVVIDEEEIIDSRPRHSYVLSVGVKYQLNPRASLYLQPRFQSTFSMNNTLPEGFNVPISQNYNLFGIQLGLSYSLN